jgi:hypothetical protein
MVHKIRFSTQWVLPVTIGMCLLALFAYMRPASALTPLPNPNPKPGSFGLEATKTQPPPKVGASITTPGNGASFAASPITVNGICPNDLLVQIYDNGVMVGSVMCKNGSFSLQVSLFAGANELSALVYDELDQAGPPSNIVTVTYTDTRFTAFGAQITLTSSYGRRSAAAGSQLGWPLQLSGGTGPYAFSLDWGDGAPTELKSQSITGIVAIAHTYKKAGIYPTNVKVTDVNGVTAFLQVVALANGKVDSASPTDKSNATAKPQILWIPTAAAMILLVPSFWLGRLSQLTTLRNKMLKEHNSHKEK